MMWALEYAPVSNQEVRSGGWSLRRKYKGRGKFEAQNEKYGAVKIPEGNAPMALFCAAAIFEMQRQRLLKETQGLDEVLKVGSWYLRQHCTCSLILSSNLGQGFFLCQPKDQESSLVK